MLDAVLNDGSKPPMSVFFQTSVARDGRRHPGGASGVALN